MSKPSEVPSGTDVDTSTLEHAGEGIAGLLSDVSEDRSAADDSPKPKSKREAPADDAVASEPEETPAESPETDAASERDEEEGGSDEPAKADAAQDEEAVMVTVKIDGKTEQVPLAELKRGYSRTKDYTVKTQAVAAEKKKVLEAQQQVRQQLDEYVAVLPQVRTALAALKAEPNWDELRKQDPERFALEHEAWQQQTARLKKIDDEIAVATKKQNELAQQAQAEYLEEQRAKLVELIPEWVDADVRTKDREQLRKFATEKLGFTDAEVDGVTDARVVLLLKQAAAYQALQGKKSEIQGKIEKERVGVRPGGGAKKPDDRAEAARKALKKSGSVDDAAVAIAGML